MAIAVACPLFWFTALRPLSDMTGLAAATAAQALLLPLVIGAPNRRAGLMLMAGVFVAAVAAGIRVQTVHADGAARSGRAAPSHRLATVAHARGRPRRGVRQAFCSGPCRWSW